MALSECADCGKQVSTRATSCPHCGAPVTDRADAIAPPAEKEWQPGGIDFRRENLEQYLVQATKSGARIESPTSSSATLVYGKPISHLLHFFISLLTCGAWVFVWLLLGIFGGEKRYRVTVDPAGQVQVHKRGFFDR